MSEVPGGRAKSLSAARAILLGTLIAGTFDALDAVVFFGWRGVAARR